jgi:hypothetical protein
MLQAVKSKANPAKTNNNFFINPPEKIKAILIKSAISIAYINR